MITTSHGKSKSVRTDAETMRILADKLATLTPDEQKAVFATLEEIGIGDDTLVGLLNASHWLHFPVSMKQFLEDPYYMGVAGASLYPKVRESLIEMFDDGNYSEVILAGSIGWGKCVDGATEFFDARSGRRWTAREMAEHSPSVRSVSFSPETGWVDCPATATFSGRKPLWTLMMASGRVLRLSPDHPVLTGDGWTRVDQLSPKVMIASPRRVQEPTEPFRVPDHEVVFVTYMLAEGACSSGNWRFTNGTQVLIDEFCHAAVLLSEAEGWRAFPNELAHRGNAAHLDPTGTRWVGHKYGLHGKNSHEKRVPADLMGVPNRQAALILNRFWATDGTVYVGRPCKIEIGLVSREMLLDIQTLLLRFGVRSSINWAPKKLNGKTFPAWRLAVTAHGDMLRFLDAVGPVLGKEAKCAELRSRLDQMSPGAPRRDLTPVTCDVLSRVQKQLGLRRNDLPAMCPGSRLGADRFRACLDPLGLPDWCSWWGSVSWDEVDSIERSDVLEPVYDLCVPGPDSWVANGLVIHNSTTASFIAARVLYEISCMRDPQRTFNLSPGSEIYLGLISKNLLQTKKVLAAKIFEPLKLSPYFADHFPWTVRNEGEEYTFPRNVVVSVASINSMDRILGSNLFSAFVDEADFLGNHSTAKLETTTGRRSLAASSKADQLYGNIVRRIKSRFSNAGKMPGKVCLISSKTVRNSFMERRIADSRTDPSVYVMDYATWEVKPPEMFSGETFKVLVGGTTARSRLLAPGEVLSKAFLDETESFVVDIPVEYHHDFVSDINGALRDVAGVSVEAVAQFIARQEKIFDAVTQARVHPFSSVEWVYGGSFHVLWGVLSQMVTRTLPGGFKEDVWVPRLNPKAPRHIHIDVAVSGDSLGFAIGHIARWVPVLRHDPNGDKYSDTAPKIVVDAMLRVMPPQGEQINLPDVRALLVYAFQEHGFLVNSLTCDSYQSVEMLQQSKARGISAEILSVDRTPAPYDAMRQALYEDRLEVYEYEPFTSEAVALSVDHVKKKIDHPPGGSKDVTDAVAGLVAGLQAYASHAPLPMVIGESGQGADEDWVNTAALPPKPKSGKKVAMPFLTSDDE